MLSHWFNSLSPAEQADYRCRNPRMGYWLRDIEEHPFINPPQPVQSAFPPPALQPAPQQGQQQPPVPQHGQQQQPAPQQGQQQLPVAQQGQQQQAIPNQGQLLPLIPQQGQLLPLIPHQGQPLPPYLGQQQFHLQPQLPPLQYYYYPPAQPQMAQQALRPEVPLPGAMAPPANHPVRTQRGARRSRPEDITELPFSIPRNTATVSAQVTRTVVMYQCDITFAEWLLRTCEIMGLDVNEADLGYKYKSQRVGDNPTQISTDEDLRIAIYDGQAMTARARTKAPRIMIYNLKPATRALTASAGRKRRVADTAEDDATRIDAGPQLRALKEHLSCAKHQGQHCYVTSPSGEHVHLGIYELSLLQMRPHFKHRQTPFPLTTAPSKPRTSVSQPAPIEIHNHINTMAAPVAPAPLSDRGGDRTVNTFSSPVQSFWPVKDEEDSDFIVDYPSIALALHELDGIMPEANMLGYVDLFRGHGMYQVDSVVGESDEWLRENIGMEHGVISAFRSHIERLVRRARKGKGRAKKVKYETDENNPIVID
ncbi:hypothetical protein HWV62_38128 [Athelia sp. TMB]|nr:hypothetical protein HWV62_38128 [Athelia sp. TMB]